MSMILVSGFSAGLWTVSSGLATNKCAVIHQRGRREELRCLIQISWRTRAIYVEYSIHKLMGSAVRVWHSWTTTISHGSLTPTVVYGRNDNNSGEVIKLEFTTRREDFHNSPWPVQLNSVHVHGYGGSIGIDFTNKLPGLFTHKNCSWNERPRATVVNFCFIRHAPSITIVCPKWYRPLFPPDDFELEFFSRDRGKRGAAAP